MKKTDETVTNKKHSDDIKALKQRFKILDPNRVPSWVHIEAAAIFEDDLWWWIGVDGNNELFYRHDIESPKSDIVAERVSLRLHACIDLCESLDMRSVWETAEYFCEGSPVKGQILLSKCLLNSLIDPNEILEVNEATKNRKDAIIESLEKAVSLIEDAPSNLKNEWANQNFEANKRLSQETYEHNIGNLPPKEQPISKKDRRNLRTYYPPYEIQLLIDSLKESTPSRGIFGRQTNGVKAARLFFIRSLTCGLLQEIGKPHRKVVAVAASAVFDCDLSTPEINRATENLNPTSEEKIISCLEKWELEASTIDTLLNIPIKGILFHKHKIL